MFQPTLNYLTKISAQVSYISHFVQDIMAIGKILGRLC